MASIRRPSTTTLAHPPLHQPVTARHHSGRCHGGECATKPPGMLKYYLILPKRGCASPETLCVKAAPRDSICVRRLRVCVPLQQVPTPEITLRSTVASYFQRGAGLAGFPLALRLGNPSWRYFLAPHWDIAWTGPCSKQASL